MTLDEAIGSLKIHEDKIRDREEEKEDRAFLASVKGKSKEHHRGRHKKRVHVKGSRRRRIVTR